MPELISYARDTSTSAPKEIKLSGIRVHLGYHLKVGLYEWMRRSAQSPTTVSRLVAESKDERFADELEKTLRQLEVEAAGDKFFVKLRKTRSPLPTNIELPPYSDAPLKEQVQGLNQLRWLENCFAHGTLRQYYIFTSPSVYDVKNVVATVSGTFSMPLDQMKVFIRSRRESQEPIQTLRKELPVDVELRHVKGVQYKRTIFELYIINMAYSVVLAGFLALLHYGKIWETPSAS